MPLILALIAGKISNGFKAIPIKLIVIVLAVLFALFVAWRIEISLSNHLKYVHQLEQQNQELTTANNQLSTQVNYLADLNAKNQAVYQESLRQADAAIQTAQEEQKAAEARTTYYRNLINEIQSTPTADRHPVSPVVQSAVNRLWNPSGSSTSGNPPGN